MGVLQRFERRLEGLVGVAFARVFKGMVHPAEIAKALEREATEQQEVVGEGRVMVPNRYVVRLGPADYDYLVEWEAELSATMAEMVQEHVAAEGWSTFGNIQVSLARDGELRTGVFHVDSRVDAEPGAQARPPPTAPRARDKRQAAGAASPRGPAIGLPPVLPPPSAAAPPGSAPARPVPPGSAPSGSAPPRPGPPRSAPPPLGLPSVPGGDTVGVSTPPKSAVPVSHALVVDGPNTRHELREGSNIIGRGTEASIRLPDTGVSRRHVDVQLANGKTSVVDLGSTNGTIVNGRRVPHVLLSDGDVIRIGHSVLVYRSDPQPGQVPS